tara:strand:+ start:314 stop:517 length:204 start_codon:yes stop_codon:yes gene_type:complete
MPFLLQYIGMTMIKKMLIGWLFESSFDAITDYAETLAKRTDTDIDDEAVRKFKDNREVFIKFAKGKL